MTRYRLTLRSANVKTGPIPVSMASADTCPPSCPLLGQGCYAESGPISWIWRRTPREGMGFSRFLGAVRGLPDGALWRHNQAGDLPGRGDRIARGAMRLLTWANRGRRGFTFTHKPMWGRWWRGNRAAVREANRGGFVVNLSADDLSGADRLAALGIAPVVVTLPSTMRENLRTPMGRLVVVCPALTHEGVTCQSCRLCAWEGREVVVGFPAHGARRGAVDRRLAG